MMKFVAPVGLCSADTPVRVLLLLTLTLLLEEMGRNYLHHQHLATEC